MNDPEASQEYRGDVIATVSNDNSFGQTIIARRQPLSALQFWYQIDVNTAPIDGILFVDVYKSIEDIDPQSNYKINFKDLIRSDNFTINLNFKNDPIGQEYYIEFTTNKGEVNILGRNEDSYPNGSALINRTPVFADMSFRLSYLYAKEAILSDLTNILDSIWLYALSFFVLIAPGYIILDKYNFGKKFSPIEIITLSIGISLAIFPVIMLWTSVLNFTWGETSIRIVFIFLAAYLLISKIPDLLIFIKSRKINVHPSWKVEILVIIVFLLALFVRIAMIRDLSAPAWIDSVHHALIADLIVDEGQFPTSYQPLYDIYTANYHPGYHTLIAIYQWLSTADIKISMLVMGQILNAVCALGSYVLTVSLTKNRVAGLFAAIITGFITPMPAYYTSWGRYTQLAGLLILPTAYILTTHLIQKRINKKSNFYLIFQDRKNLSLFCLIAIIYAGLFLTHYRVSAFFACAIIAYIIIYLIKIALKKQSFRNIIPIITILLLVCFISIVITAPWWPDTVKTLFVPRLETVISQRPSLFSDFSWAYLTPVYGQIAMILAGIGFLVGIYHKKLFSLLLVIWIILMFLLANLNSLGLPGADFVNNTSVAITLFIPISILAGYLIAAIIQIGGKPLQGYLRTVYVILISAGVMSAIWLGANRTLPLLNPGTLLYREADSKALDWLDRNTPSDTRIVINPFLWGYGMYAGNDGGYWITPITKRLSFPPPALYGLSAPLSSEVNQICQKVNELSNDVNALHQYLVANKIEYIFIGARGGILSPYSLTNSPYYEKLYSQDGAWIFKVRNP